jgi:PAS domain S-box-containing protein
MSPDAEGSSLPLAELERVNRAMRLVCGSNLALVRLTDELTVLREVCRIAVEVGGYRMAWVGVPQEDEQRTVRPVAQVGFDAGYLECVTITSDGGPRSCGPTGTAIRTGEVSFARNITGDPAFSEWREAALQRGFRSSIALPLRSEGLTLGVLNIYAAEPDAFDASEVAILSELANDLAFGLTVLRTRAERDRATEALKENEALLEAAQRTTHVGHWERDVASNQLKVSAEFYRILGLEPLGRPLTLAEFIERVHPDDRASVAQRVAETVREGERVEAEFRISRPDGEVRFLHGVQHLIRGDAGREYRTFGTIQDITEHKEAETLLHAREQEFRAFVENAPDLIARLDRELVQSYVNPALTRMYGLTPDAFVGRRLGSFPPGVEVETDGRAIAEIRRAVAAVFATGGPEEAELTWPMPAGRKTFSARFFPELDQTGAVSSVLGISRDVTALKESQRQLLALVENSPDLIMRFDRDGHYLYVNAAMERLTGFPARELTGRRIGEVLSDGMGRAPKSDVLAARRAIEQVFETGSAVETEVGVSPKGTDRVFDIRLIPERDGSEQVASVLAIGRDITERRCAEDALRDSEQRFRQVTEGIEEVFWLADVAGTEMFYVSPAYEKVWGRTRESLLAEPWSWMDAILPVDQERVLQTLRLHGSAGHEIEYRIMRPDGALRWIHQRAFPVKDGRDQVYRVAGLALDVTDRRQLEEQFRQAQKMEAVGQLAGGIAHDFNNLLGVIRGNTDLALLDLGENADVRYELEQIRRAAIRAAALTQQLLVFSRKQVLQPRIVDLNEVISDVAAMLQRLIEENIDVVLDLEPRLGPVRVDPGQFHQVLLNLALNARDAMPEGGTLRIHTRNVTRAVLEGDEDHPTTRDFVCLSVIDTGVGIAPDVRERIFEPFFTTKAAEKGSGLGLSTAYGIVERSGGEIEVESVEGRGASFHVYVPQAISTETAAPRETPRPPEARSPGGTILLVEDEDALRELTRKILEREGYTVLEARNGEEALARWAGPSSAVDLLLTDVVMPGLSGKQLAERLVEKRPGVRVLFMSGYSDDVLSSHGALESGTELLQKPASAAEITSRVRALFGQERRP